MDVVVPLHGTQPDYALRGLVLLAQFHGIAADEQQLAHDFGRGGEAFDESALLLAARQLGLKARFHPHPASRIGSANLPALACSAGEIRNAGRLLRDERRRDDSCAM